MNIIESLPKVETYEQFKEEYFRELHKRAKKGMKEKAERGELPGCPPVGYLNLWDGSKKAVVIDPIKAPLIQEAFQIASQNRLSLRKILMVLTNKGLASRNGKSLGVSALWGILTNEFYLGRVRFYDELLPGNHESLISEEMFMQVQQNLKSRSKTKTLIGRTGKC